MVIPPFLFYMIGAMLIAFGAFRAYQLGWRGRDDDEDKRRRTSRRRHMAMGLLWVAMGGYVVYTAVALQRRMDEPVLDDTGLGDRLGTARTVPRFELAPGVTMAEFLNAGGSHPDGGASDAGS